MPALDNTSAIIDFTNGNTTDLFKLKITSRTGYDATESVEIMVPLKYLSNFYRTLQMPLINSEVNLILNWYKKCVISSNALATQATTFAITDTKFNVRVITLST